MLIFISIIGLLFIHYLLLLTRMALSISSNSVQKSKIDIVNNTFSIVIPFRNEEANIKRTVESLARLNYSKKYFEIILVNDHSEDDFSSQIENIKPVASIVVIDNKGVGKKEAIETGVSLAKNTWILCSDADCTFNEDWLDGCNNALNNSEADLYLFPVIIESNSGLLGRFQFYDQLSTLGFNAGFYFLKGISLLANGANIMFRKTDFQSIDPYRKNKGISSGDDMFLLQKFKENGLNIKMSLAKELWVKTRSQKTWNSFLDQRIRWVKKMKYLKTDLSFYLGMYIFAIQVSLWASLILGFFNTYLFGFFLALLLVKSVGDIILIKRTAKLKDLRIKLEEVFFFEFVYIFLIPFILVISIFKTPDWKGRKLLNRI